MAPALLLVVGLVAPACGGGDDDDGGPPDPYTSGNLSPAQLCSNVAADQCDKIFSCATPGQLPSDFRISCFGDAIQKLRCTSATITNLCAGTAIGAQQLGSCSAQVKAATCEQVNRSSSVISYAMNCGPCAIR